MNIFNPMLSDDDELFSSDEDELDSLPDFDEEDLEKFIESSDSAEKRDLVPGSIDDSYPVNYDDYVQQDIERGVREPDDADRTYEESFRSVLEDAGYEPDDFSSVDVVDDDTVGEGVNSGGEVFEEEVEEYSPSTSLEELLALQEAAEEDDESIDGASDEDGGDYPLSGSMFYISDDDDEDGLNSHQLDIDAIITKAIDMGASDIDVIPNDEVTFTVLGEVMRIPQFGVITNRQVANSYRDITSSQAQDDFLRFPEMDTSYEVRRGKHQGRRLRLSVGKTFDNHFMVFRVISNHIPSPQEIGMDARLLRWSTLPNGLVMVNGKTGAGKSTTLASIIREIQLNRSDKIITVEKPVEYVYGIAGRSSVTQREVGRDTKSFAAALDSAMRQHPDVLLIGEVRNQEEVSALLYAAETGHLAFSTMHTNSAPHTLNRIKRLFSGEEQVRILGDLSEVARGFSNQLLVKSLDGKSRSSVNEVLEVDDTVKNLILNGDVRGIVNYQEELGITMEHELVKAVIEGRCSVEEARKVSSFRPRLDKILEENDLV